jgi:hypothetical protein
MTLCRAALGFALLLCACWNCLATPQNVPQTGGPDVSKSAPIRVDTSLVTVDVVVEDKKTGEPIKELAKEDFLLRNDGKPTDISSFNRGKDQNLRPLQLWFVLVCDEERHYQVGGRRRTQIESTEMLGASFLAGKTAEVLRPGLEHLNKDETIGVAHWCDNGESEIDQPPTTDREQPLQAMERIVSRKRVVLEDMSNEDNRGHVLGLIEDVSRTAFPVPMSVIVFVGEKAAGAAGKAEDASSGIMEFWSTDYGAETGKGVSGAGDSSSYKVQNSEYGDRLGKIIDILHSRYELSFLPGKPGKKVHRVEVSMQKSSREIYANALIRYRDVYRDDTQGESAEEKKPAAKLKQLDSRMQAAVKSQKGQEELRFEVHETSGVAAGTERFAVRVDPRGLTWTMLPNGDRRSIVTMVVASYSPKGQPIGLVVKELEIVEASEKLKVLKDKPVQLTVTANVLKGAARVRLVVRDVATGHIGTQDVQPVAMVGGGDAGERWS